MQTHQVPESKAGERHRYRTVIEKEKLHIVEYFPACRTIKINGHVHYLSLPYIQWYLKPHHKSGYKNLWSIHMSFRNEPLEDLSEQVALPLVPNVYPDTSGHTKPGCQVCNSFGGGPDGGGMTKKAFGNIFEIVDLFWNSGFHTNYPFKSKELLPKCVLKDYTTWGVLTRENQFFATEIEWPEYTTAQYIVDTTQQREYCMFSMNPPKEKK